MSASGKFIRWPWLATLKLGSASHADPSLAISASHPIVTSEDSSFNLAMLAEQCGEAVVICDARQRIIFANAAFERLTGFAAHELIGEKSERIRGSTGDDVTIVSSAIPAWPAPAAHFVFVLAPAAQAKRAAERLRQFVNLA